MTVDQSTVVLGEAWVPPATRGHPYRVAAAVAYFVRRKPLGAFGGLLVLVPILMTVLGYGFTLGPVHVPGLLTSRGYDDYQLGQDILAGPSWNHPFGTDHLGRDNFARVLYGTRLSFAIGIGIVLISTVLSTTLTMIAAYYVRTVDLFMQRGIEVINFVPDLILLVTLFSIYGATPLTLILTLGVLNGINTGRVLRAVVIGLRGLPYVEAAKALGASDLRIISRHLLPNVMFLIIIGSTGAIAIAMVIEAGLAILGFGINQYPTIGNLLNESRQYLRVAPWLAVAPGIALFLILLGSRLFGDALRDVLDPRLRGSR
jgi:peptide/nickel transport system permease protein